VVVEEASKGGGAKGNISNGTGVGVGVGTKTGGGVGTGGGGSVVRNTLIMVPPREGNLPRFMGTRPRSMGFPAFLGGTFLEGTFGAIFCAAFGAAQTAPAMPIITTTLPARRMNDLCKTRFPKDKIKNSLHLYKRRNIQHEP
jgi:hypothetical protein